MKVIALGCVLVIPDAFHKKTGGQWPRVSLSVINGIIFLKICRIKIMNCVVER